MANSSETPNLEIPAVMRNLRGRNLQVVGERAATAQPTLEQREKALSEKDADLRAALVTINTAFRILGARALVVLTATVAAGMFGWSCYSASGWSIAAALAFTLTVFLPALLADARNAA